MALSDLTNDKYLVSTTRVKCRRCGKTVELSAARNKKEKDEQQKSLLKLSVHYCLIEGEGKSSSKPLTRSDGDKCRACPQLIRWAVQNPTDKNPDPRPNPLDINPSPNGNIRLDLKTMRYDVLSGEEREKALAAGEELYLSHFATCPNRGEFKGS